MAEKARKQSLDAWFAAAALCLLVVGCQPVKQEPQPAEAPSPKAARGSGLRPVPVQPTTAPRLAGANESQPAPVQPRHRGGAPLPEQDLFYDRANPDLHVLQKANQALAGFPVDPQGYVDWVEALREGLITPRTGVRENRPHQVLDLDVVMTGTKDMPHVVFPHRTHTEWLDCSNCHPAPFQEKADAHEILMADIFRGRYCGMCHDRVAFLSYFSCYRCHRGTP